MDFRLYRLNARGEVASPSEEFFATSDDAALSYAARQPALHGCEVWAHDRFVAYVPPIQTAASETAEPSRWRRFARAVHLPGA